MDQDSEIQNQDFLSTSYGLMNHNSALLKNEKVRQALSVAVNREELAAEVLEMGSDLATGMLPSGMHLSNGEGVKTLTGDHGIDVALGDLEAARQLFHEAGLSNPETKPTLRLLTTPNDKSVVMANKLESVWESALNIDIEVRYYEWNKLQAAIDDGNYDIALMGWIADYNDPATFLEIWQSDSEDNHSNWSNNDYDVLMQKSRWVHGEIRDQVIADAERILMDETVMIPFYHYVSHYMVSENVIQSKLSKLGIWYFGRTDILNTPGE